MKILHVSNTHAQGKQFLCYAMRSGMAPQEAVEALAGIGCCYGKRTCMNAVAEARRDVLDQGKNEKVVRRQIIAS